MPRKLPLESGQAKDSNRPKGDESRAGPTLSWLMIHRSYQDPAKLPALIHLVEYALGPARKVPEALGYIGFSAEGVEHVRGLLAGLSSRHPEAFRPGSTPGIGPVRGPLSVLG